MEDEKDDLFKKVASLERRVKATKKTVAALNVKAKYFHDRLVVLNRLCRAEDLEDRLESIDGRILSLIVKDSVCSEVARCYPNLANRLWRLSDEDDKFWIDRDTWTINDWADHLMTRQEAQA